MLGYIEALFASAYAPCAEMPVVAHDVTDMSEPDPAAAVRVSFVGYAVVRGMTEGAAKTADLPGMSPNMLLAAGVLAMARSFAQEHLHWSPQRGRVAFVETPEI